MRCGMSSGRAPAPNRLGRTAKARRMPAKGGAHKRILSGANRFARITTNLSFFIRIIRVKRFVASFSDTTSHKECLMTLEAYLQQTAPTHAERMAWGHAPRFGTFIHWGLESQPGRPERVMTRRRSPVPEHQT